MSSRYNVLQAPFMSFYSKRLYRDVALNWRAKSVFYLFFILALSWIGFTMQLQSGLNRSFNVYSQKIMAQAPVITITNGVLSTPENRPYIINNPDTGTPAIVIDTSGQFKTIDEAKALIFINQTEVVSRSRPNQTRLNKIPAKLSVTINPSAIQAFLVKYLQYAWMLAYPLLLLLSFVYRLIEVWIYAIIGKIFCLICEANITYRQVRSMTMVALTPTIAAATAFDYFGVSFRNQLSFYFLLAMAYILYGAIANITVVPEAPAS